VMAKQFRVRLDARELGRRELARRQLPFESNSPVGAAQSVGR